eukprot:PhF_6_TR32158/c0_g1_i2/m.47699
MSDPPAPPRPKGVPPPPPGGGKGIPGAPPPPPMKGPPMLAGGPPPPPSAPPPPAPPKATPPAPPPAPPSTPAPPKEAPAPPPAPPPAAPPGGPASPKGAPPPPPSGAKVPPPAPPPPMLKDKAPPPPPPSSAPVKTLPPPTPPTVDAPKAPAPPPAPAPPAVKAPPPAPPAAAKEVAPPPVAPAKEVTPPPAPAPPPTPPPAVKAAPPTPAPAPAPAPPAKEVPAPPAPTPAPPPVQAPLPPTAVKSTSLPPTAPPAVQPTPTPISLPVPSSTPNLFTTGSVGGIFSLSTDESNGRSVIRASEDAAWETLHNMHTIQFSYLQGQWAAMRKYGKRPPSDDLSSSGMYHDSPWRGGIMTASSPHNNRGGVGGNAATVTAITATIRQELESEFQRKMEVERLRMEHALRQAEATANRREQEARETEAQVRQLWEKHMQALKAQLEAEAQAQAQWAKKAREDVGIRYGVLLKDLETQERQDREVIIGFEMQQYQGLWHQSEDSKRIVRDRIELKRAAVIAQQEAAKKKQFGTASSSSSSSGVSLWLESNGLGQYSNVFAENDVSLDTLPLLTAEDLTAMGIIAIGAKRKLLHEISKLNVDNNNSTTRGSPARGNTSGGSGNVIDLPLTLQIDHWIQQQRQKAKEEDFALTSQYMSLLDRAGVSNNREGWQNAWRKACHLDLELLSMWIRSGQERMLFNNGGGGGGDEELPVSSHRLQVISHLERTIPMF